MIWLVLARNGVLVDFSAGMCGVALIAFCLWGGILAAELLYDPNTEGHW